MRENLERGQTGLAPFSGTNAVDALTVGSQSPAPKSACHGSSAGDVGVRQILPDHFGVRKEVVPRISADGSVKARPLGQTADHSDAYQSKFFGRAHGSKSKSGPSQQTTLSFAKSSSKKPTGTIPEDDPASEATSRPAKQAEKEDGTAVDSKDTDGPSPGMYSWGLLPLESNRADETVFSASRKRARTVLAPKPAAKEVSRKPAASDDVDNAEDSEPVAKKARRSRQVIQDEDEDEVMDEAPAAKLAAKKAVRSKKAAAQVVKEEPDSPTALESERDACADAGSESDSGEDVDEKAEVGEKTRKVVQSTPRSQARNDAYPDWKPGEPVPYAALCTTFSLIEMTRKRLEIAEHCSLFLRQVMRLSPADLLPTVLLMINKLAPDYAGIELGIGESLIMKAIGDTTGRSLAVIKQDQQQIGDLGVVAIKSRNKQPTMFKPKPLTVPGVLKGLMGIATTTGNGAQGRKVDGIKKLLSAADAHSTAKADMTQDKGGPSEAKYLVRFLEGKLRLGLAEKTVLVSLAQAAVWHEAGKKGTVPSTTDVEKGEATLKTVYRSVTPRPSLSRKTSRADGGAK